MAWRMGHQGEQELAAFPRVIVTETAGRGLEACRRFLASSNPQAMRAGQVTGRHFQLLETTPDMGWPLPELPEVRKLLVASVTLSMLHFTDMKLPFMQSLSWLSDIRKKSGMTPESLRQSNPEPPYGHDRGPVGDSATRCR